MSSIVTITSKDKRPLTAPDPRPRDLHRAIDQP
jgi:hypothetical protein